MLAYPPPKKWMLIQQDAISQNNSSKKRGARGFQSKQEEKTPEWYVRKIMDSSISAKELEILNVSLRTEEVEWVREFLRAQGQVALSTVLSHINQKSSPLSEEMLDREYDFIKCLKALVNFKDGADDALKTGKCCTLVVQSLISSRLSTRKLVTDLLVFFITWDDYKGHGHVISAMDQMKGHIGDIGRFETWLKVVESTLDGRGKMGSLVGASEELRGGGIGTESLLMDYGLSTMILVNGIVDGAKDLKVRIHIRSQLKASGLPRIAAKLQQLHYDSIDEYIRKYDEQAALDYEDLLSIEREEDIKDMEDPVEISKEIWSRVRGTNAEGFFLSAMQHFLLVREDPKDDGARMFQLVDALMSHVVMDRISPDVDLRNVLNISVQHILGRLQTDDQARRAYLEAKEAMKEAEEARIERDHIQQLANLGADGLVGRLQKQLDEQAEMLQLQRRVNEGLQQDLDDLKQSHVVELQNQELEIRELYLMLKEQSRSQEKNVSKTSSKAGTTGASLGNGILDRDQLARKLEAQLARKKTEYKLEGKAWELEPSPRLRELRDKMEALQMTARELEFDFQENDEVLHNPPGSSIVDLHEQRMLRLKQLEDLQLRSNDVAKFVGDEEDSMDFNFSGSVPSKARVVMVGRANGEGNKPPTGFLSDLSNKISDRREVEIVGVIKGDTGGEKPAIASGFASGSPFPSPGGVPGGSPFPPTGEFPSGSPHPSPVPSTGFNGPPPPPPPPPPPAGFNGLPPPPPPPPPPTGFN